MASLGRASIDTAQLKARLRLVDYVSRRVQLHPDGPRLKVSCPFHHDPNPSFKIWPDEDRWECFGCRRRGDVIDYIGHELYNGSWYAQDKKQFRHVIDTARGAAGDSIASGTYGRRTEYVYRTDLGEPAYRTVRVDLPDGKKTWQERSDGRGGWLRGLEGVTRLPYRLPELLNAPSWETVYIPEGEKCVEALRGLGQVATCNSEGAGKWRSELSHWLEGRYVVILPDNDDVGRKHAEQVAQNLYAIAKRVKVLDL